MNNTRPPPAAPSGGQARLEGAGGVLPRCKGVPRGEPGVPRVPWEEKEHQRPGGGGGFQKGEGAGDLSARPEGAVWPQDRGESFEGRGEAVKGRRNRVGDWMFFLGMSMF